MRGPRSPRRKRLLILLAVPAALLLLALSGVTVYAVGIARAYDDNRHVLGQAFPSSGRPAAVSGKAAGAVNLLVVGTDTRGSETTGLGDLRDQNADTLMLVHVPADRQHLYVMSILRDTRITLPDGSAGTINQALSVGGVPLLVKEVEGVIGVRVDHVAVAAFTGFEALTDAIGGVTVDNPRSFTSFGSDFPEGRQDLDGAQALKFVRARFPLHEGDVQRVRNEQAYMRGLVASMLKTTTVLNPFQMGSAVTTMSSYLRVDRGFDSAYIAQLAVSLRSVRQKDVTFFNEPSTGLEQASDGTRYSVIDTAGLQRIRDALRDDDLATVLG